MEILLIRHGKTGANLEQRYVGASDPPLCSQGEEELRGKRYPAVKRVFSSPLLRCIRSAEILFPDCPPTVVSQLREMCFGEFEGMTHQEIIRLPGRERWGMTEEEMVFPGGEDWEEFARRSRAGFLEAVSAAEGAGRAAVVCHGGTVMAVMECLGTPPRESRYSWMCGCGGGVRVRWDGERAVLEGIL